MTTTRSRRMRRSRRRGATTRGPRRSTATTSTQIHPLYPSLNLLLFADQSVFQLIHRSEHVTSPPTTSQRLLPRDWPAAGSYLASCDGSDAPVAKPVVVVKPATAKYKPTAKLYKAPKARRSL